jgi:hypothetical protein
MTFNYNNAVVVISSTVIASVTCVICIVLPENDEDDNTQVGVVREDIIVVEPDAIVVNVRDEDITEIEEQSAIQINDDFFRNLNTPQAIIVATVVPSQYY